jgi:hypothetical protein
VTTPAAPVASASPTDQPPVTTEPGSTEPRTPGEAIVDNTSTQAGTEPEVGKPMEPPTDQA